MWDCPYRIEGLSGLAILQKALDAKDVKNICYFSWKVKSLVVFASDNGLYNTERVAATIELLKRAAEVTKGTFVEKNCATRPKAFSDRVSLGLAVHEKAAATVGSK